MSENLLQLWTKATDSLPWGKQRVLHDTLTLVANDQIKVVWGANDFNGSPCLINAVGCMVKSAHEAPATNEPQIVMLFDKICRQFMDQGVVDDQYLSPLGAEILMRYFAPLKETPVVAQAEIVDEAYYEPSDADIQAAWDAANETPAPSETEHILKGE